MNVFFSVVVPLYNCEKTISRVLQSILNQTLSDFELILVNDGSIDSTEEIVLKNDDPRIRYFKKENGGVSSARNYGIINSTGQYLAFCDSDDYWQRDFLSVFYRSIIRTKQKDLYYCKFLFKNKIYGRNIFFLKDVYFLSKLSKNTVSSSSVVLKKTTVENVGYFRENLRIGEDIDYWMRFVMLGKVKHINKVLVYISEGQSKWEEVRFFFPIWRRSILIMHREGYKSNFDINFLRYSHIIVSLCEMHTQKSRKLKIAKIILLRCSYVFIFRPRYFLKFLVRILRSE